MSTIAELGAFLEREGEAAGEHRARAGQPAGSGLAETEFRRHAAEAKANCPVSKALAGVPEITLSAKLE